MGYLPPPPPKTQQAIPAGYRMVITPSSGDPPLPSVIPNPAPRPTSCEGCGHVSARAVCAYCGRGR